MRRGHTNVEAPPFGTRLRNVQGPETYGSEVLTRNPPFAEQYRLGLCGQPTAARPMGAGRSPARYANPVVQPSLQETQQRHQRAKLRPDNWADLHWGSSACPRLGLQANRHPVVHQLLRRDRALAVVIV